MAAGRDQRKPMERLVRMAAALRAAGPVGISGERLAELAEFEGDARADQVARELRHLNNLGWQIDNIAAIGDPARYRMTTVDNRLRLKLSAGQQAALRRAALLADRADLADRLGLPASDQPAAPAEMVEVEHDPVLGDVLEAVREKAVISFRYKGTERRVHPEAVRTQYRAWYLTGVEEGTERLKHFVVSRMSDVEVGTPGTARPVVAERREELNPMSWQVDPPVEVALRTDQQFLPDVHRWLGAPQSERRDGDTVDLTYRVTHRAALFDRLYELGTRVDLLGPDDVRAELLAELTTMAGR